MNFLIIIFFFSSGHEIPNRLCAIQAVSRSAIEAYIQCGVGRPYTVAWKPSVFVPAESMRLHAGFTDALFQVIIAYYYSGQKAGSFMALSCGYICRMSSSLWAKTNIEWSPLNARRRRGTPRKMAWRAGGTFSIIACCIAGSRRVEGEFGQHRDSNG